LTGHNGAHRTRIASFRYDTAVAVGAPITVAGLFTIFTARSGDSRPQRRQRQQRWQIAQVALNPFGPIAGLP
jgi:hypothetical protein